MTSGPSPRAVDRRAPVEKAPNPKPVGATAPSHGPVLVSGASSLREVLTALAARYEESHAGVSVTLNFGPSNVLARQIVELAPVDLFVSADGASMDAVEKQGRVLPGTRVDLLSNSLVVVVPSDAADPVRSWNDLASSRIRRIAVCDASVPIGGYARTWLASKGLLARLSGRMVRPDDARATLAMVESGSVDAGFVYKTDARAARRSRVAFEIPSGETPGIIYPAAVMARGPNPGGGKSFLDFATTSHGIRLFSGAGFVVLENPPPKTTRGGP